MRSDHNQQIRGLWWRFKAEENSNELREMKRAQFIRV